jgi:hypothetical protein
MIQNPDTDPYLVLLDPDPERAGLKTYRSAVNVVPRVQGSFRSLSNCNRVGMVLKKNIEYIKRQCHEIDNFSSTF